MFFITQRNIFYAIWTTSWAFSHKGWWQFQCSASFSSPPILQFSSKFLIYYIQVSKAKLGKSECWKLSATWAMSVGGPNITELTACQSQRIYSGPVVKLVNVLFSSLCPWLLWWEWGHSRELRPPAELGRASVYVFISLHIAFLFPELFHFSPFFLPKSLLLYFLRGLYTWL